MKKLFFNLLLSVVILLSIPFSALAEGIDQNSQSLSGQFHLVEIQNSVEDSQTFRSEIPIFTEEYVLVEQEDTSQSSISTMSNIGGYGTISCFDGGDQVMVCDVSFTLTGGALIKGVEATVTTYNNQALQWGTETLSYWLSGTLFSTFNNQIEEPLYVAGKYYATVTGAVSSVEKIYAILPVKSASVTIN